MSSVALASMATNGLNTDEWLSVIGLVLAIPPLVGFFVSFIIRIRRASPEIALHEFILLIRQPWNVVLLLVAVGSLVYLVIAPPGPFPASLSLLIPVVAGLALMASFFVAQSRQLSGAVLLNEMRSLSSVARERHNGVSSAVRFDIDRLKALADFSLSLSEGVRETVEGVIHEEVVALRREGLDAVSIAIPGEDEIVVMAAGMTVDRGAIFADRVRARVKERVGDLPNYREAVDLLTERMEPPPTREEERKGIGTVSAGVAADRGRAEIWLSDVSAAVKESKVRGRNKTVVYRPGRAPEVR